MAINLRGLGDFRRRCLFWYQHSLWFNWLWLPIFGGMAMAPFFVQRQYSDLYEVIRKSETFTVTGTFEQKYAKKVRRFSIKTKQKEYNAYCTMAITSVASCININKINKNIEYHVKMYKYHGYNIIASIHGVDGTEILTKQKQLNFIKLSSSYLSEQSYFRQVVIGIIAGLISVAPIRYIFTIRLRRKKLKGRAGDK